MPLDLKYIAIVGSFLCMRSFSNCKLTIDQSFDQVDIQFTVHNLNGRISAQEIDPQKNKMCIPLL